MSIHKNSITKYPVVIELNSLGEIVEYTGGVNDYCKGVRLKKVFHLLSEDGAVSVNNAVFGSIQRNESGLFVRMNSCNNQNLNRNGTCKNCYQTYRNSLKRANYERKQRRNRICEEVEKLKKVSLIDDIN